MENSSLSKQQDSTCCVSCFGGDRKVQRGPDDVTDSFLASELNELSVEERERVYEEIHGVAPIIEETPELLQDAFADFTTALSNIPKRQRRAYDRAIFLKPSICKDRKFKLMFLRADQYEASKAARRMCNYFTSKLELFGHEKLVKKITLSDLNEDDMAAVNTGSVHILPHKDSAGRAVWFVAQQHYKYKHWQNQIRYQWYTLMGALENEDAQLHGLVNVTYCVNMVDTEQNFTHMITQGGPLLMGLPFRLVGLHYCYNDARLRPAVSVIQMMLGTRLRLRFRTHYGSNVESQYALLTFGIPMGCIPIRADGSLKIEVNKGYLDERRCKEAEWQKEEESCTVEEPCCTIILYPTAKDVLLGRGRPYQEYFGNQIMAQKTELHREQYQQAIDRCDKTYLSLDVVKTIQESGGRFLQRIPEEGWEEVGDDAAREKVSQLLRAKPTQQIRSSGTSSRDDTTSSKNKRSRYS